MSSTALLGIGVSHHTASVAIRERLALTPRQAAELLRALVGGGRAQEAVAVSTCNRTEVYLAGPHAAELEAAGLAALAARAGVAPEVLAGDVEIVRGAEVAEHLFAVTAGIQSMVVGESEIQGQVRRAHDLALAEGTSGPLMDRLFRDALSAGRRVRTRTGIGRSGVSVASAAVELARDTLGGLDGRRVIVVGAGKTGALAARALADQGLRLVFVANRGYERAVEVARHVGVAVPFDDLDAELRRADIVLTSTGAPHHLFGRERLAAALGARGGRPLLVIDIAMPRDVDPAARDLDGLTLFDLDDIERRVQRNLEGRRSEIDGASVLVQAEASRFERWRRGLVVVPTVTALRERGDAIVDELLRENRGRWDALSPADRARVETVARTVVNRLLHEPTMCLKRSADAALDAVPVDVVRELFGLGQDAVAAPRAADGSV